MNLLIRIGQAHMGNDTACQIKEIGKFNLLLNNTYIFELSEAKYVPDLLRNLISLGELYNEYEIKIYKRFSKINLNKKIISYPKVNVIYILQVEPLVENSLASIKSYVDKSFIWQKSHSHISEKELLILNKIGCFENTLRN